MTDPHPLRPDRERILWGSSLPRENAFSVVVPAGIATQNDLYSSLSESLRFPDYFGWNWNAFEDCINDLSWLAAPQIVVHHQDIPFEKGSRDRKIYLEIIREICSENRWRSDVIPPVDFFAFFPARYLLEIDQVLSEDH